MVAWTAVHSAWGKVVETYANPLSELNRGRNTSSPFRLLGQYADEEIGLCYTRFRYFDPEVGRWCSPDPLGFLGGANLFGFDRSPTHDVDPLGLSNGSPHKVNIDTGTAVALSSEDPKRADVEKLVAGKDMVMTQTAANEFQNITNTIGGPNEKARAAALMANVTVVPDDPSARAAALNVTKSVGANDKVILGTADKMGIPTVTADSKFVRGSAAQGVNFNTITHDPVPLQGK
jgi:RHS repeat-associated protein